MSIRFPLLDLLRLLLEVEAYLDAYLAANERLRSERAAAWPKSWRRATAAGT